ncbi:MAG: cobalt-precorrin-5B (C(1))-methyltransferase CbiD [Termitinemataceae bacterium]|nr:MAG: cobalt-precorrin-5B (C(1))-methyltransferase CbiD [Termitinemataceae bacterium]
MSVNIPENKIENLHSLVRIVNGKIMRRGYTTGTCAAAAAGAATAMLLGQNKIETFKLMTPKGIELTLPILDASFNNECASCAVKKDAGDDPDATNGILVYAQVSKIFDASKSIIIDGGVGVGRVTKPGLDQAVGQAAINSTPRKMITSECQKTANNSGYTGGLSVIISIPQGVEIAKRTFNPRVGIVGGISVLGTGGIVEPMSEAAYIETIRMDLHRLLIECGTSVVFTIGNFAEDFSQTVLKLNLKPNHVKCSNFVGDALDAAAELGFKHVLIVGHIGKLVKLGLGMFNTHSSHGDGRIETLSACALEAGASLKLLKNISACVTTDAALVFIEEEGLLQAAMSVLQKRIEAALLRRCSTTIETGFVIFNKNLADTTRRNGKIICKSSNTEKIIRAAEMRN